MRRGPSSFVLTACAAMLAGSLLAAAPALAQRDGDYVECYRDGRRVSCDSASRAERERALTRAREARERAQRVAEEARDRAQRSARESRERALEAARVQARARQRETDWRREEEKRRVEDRLRDARRAIDAARQRVLVQTRAVQPRRYRDDFRTRLSLGGGADIRRFGETNRYVASGAVEFRGPSGVGVRPEVVYGWSDRTRELLPTLVCAACTSILPGTSLTPAELRARNQMLGVLVNASYTLAARSAVRPYVLGGVGVFSTRETAAEVATSVALGGTPALSQVTYRLAARDRVDLGLNAGAGLEFGRGPVRPYAEFRYFLHDTATPRGFSGMLPITVGLRF